MIKVKKKERFKILGVWVFILAEMETPLRQLHFLEALQMEQRRVRLSDVYHCIRYLFSFITYAKRVEQKEIIGPVGGGYLWDHED